MSCKSHALHNVRRLSALGDGSWPLINHSVPNLARRIIIVVVGPKQLAHKTALESGNRGGRENSLGTIDAQNSATDHLVSLQRQVARVTVSIATTHRPHPRLHTKTR